MLLHCSQRFHRRLGSAIRASSELESFLPELKPLSIGQAAQLLWLCDLGGLLTLLLRSLSAAQVDQLAFRWFLLAGWGLVLLNNM